MLGRVVRMIIQIYEIQTPEEAEACMELGVNQLGSVLLSHENWQSSLLREVMRSSTGTETRNSLIPLFQKPLTLFRALDYYRPHYIHFCETLTSNNGHEIDLEAFISMQIQVKKRFPEIGIIRSIPIPRKGMRPHFPTLKIAKALEPFSDLFLTDTWVGQEPVKGFIGITGKTPDWDMAEALVAQSDIPVILAGGLSPENVYEAIRYACYVYLMWINNNDCATR